ncbi:unnamed protein product [Pieris macdunnoughi]|uniref:HTH CENPB-type domain-containing protein n=1 Tax=Pieris macdunnoughi TaxID=345717 RepID=A0A821XM91_9NEOP|nr:unnamed protein product [Pieris macdunnoughi]
MSKRKYKTLSVSEKVKLLSHYDCGKSRDELIINNKEKIRSQCIDGKGKLKRIRAAEYPEVEKCLCTWIKQVRNNNIPISTPMIKEKAQEFASKLHIDNFSGSNGWLEGFKKRNNIAFKNVCGESNSVENNECNEWIKNLLALLHDYSPDDVFNADEAGLFYKCLPDKTFTFKGQSCHGGKLSKDRVTVLKNKSPEINILQAMRFARKPWFSVSKTTISNCFQRAGFKVTNVSEPESLQEELEICAAFPEWDRIFTTCRNDLNEQQEICAAFPEWDRIFTTCRNDLNEQQVTFQDFVSMDVLIEEELNDVDIVSMYSSLDTEEEEDCEETPIIATQPKLPFKREGVGKKKKEARLALFTAAHTSLRVVDHMREVVNHIHMHKEDETLK